MVMCKFSHVCESMMCSINKQTGKQTNKPKQNKRTPTGRLQITLFFLICHGLDSKNNINPNLQKIFIFVIIACLVKSLGSFQINADTQVSFPRALLHLI